MRRAKSLALVAVLAPALAAIPVAVSAGEKGQAGAGDEHATGDGFGMDWDLGEESPKFDDQSATGTDGWSDDWGNEPFGSDEYGRFDGRFDWDVDDRDFDTWYGESHDWFDPGGET